LVKTFRDYLQRILGVSDGALSNFAGWVAGSNQLKIYSHLSGGRM